MKTLTTALSAATLLGCSNLMAQDRPNIILFLVDDMGLMDTSVPFIADKNGETHRYPLNDWYHTPSMERLAHQGICFTTFYAQSVSSPSRTSILTGQGSARHRTTNWINGESNNYTTYGPREWNWEGIHVDTPIYPKILKEAGYKTIHVGKAHFGNVNSISKDPTKVGFDVNIGGCAHGQPGSYYGESGYGWIKGNRMRAVPDLEKYHGTDTFLTDALTIEAENEIEKCVKEGKPFYLNMSHYAVHQPFETDKRFIDHYNKSDKSKSAQAFATLIEGMDKSLGDIMDKVNELGIAENTLIIFLGDNGGDAPLGKPNGHGSSAPLRGKKGSVYEGGTRVPFIAGWAKPDSKNKFQKKYPIAINAVQNQQATVMDLYPTILSVAGAKAPKKYVLDGQDMKKLLSGKHDKKHRTDFLSHFPHGEHNSNYFTTYRVDDWKIIYFYNPATTAKPTIELYNLVEDPFEDHNVASDNKDKVKELFQLMKERLNEEKALYPIDKQGNTLYPVLPEMFQ